ncbi:MAG: WhiB family transcriptional regulator [Mycolicibacterium sp.]|uniref:WhiB family transcriptional regulator n=1 Tax=Mycolicibacterium sp. TaxID=2320850 RepID=UPI003D142FC2
MDTYPCHADPDLFFGGHIEYETTDRGGPPLHMTQRAQHLSARARNECLRKCPLEQMRRCAKTALESGAPYGVWAGVQLPGGQTRKIPVLQEQRKILAGIANGDIDPRTHPSNADLLAHTDQLALFAPRQGRPAPTPMTGEPHAATA